MRDGTEVTFPAVATERLERGTTSTSDRYPAWFEAWWTLYVSLSGRGRNKRGTFAKAKTLDVRETLTELTRQHAELRTRAEAAGVFVPPWPDPERYISKRGWEDVYVVPPSQNGGQVLAESVSDNQRFVREEIEHEADPRWPEYDRLVVAGKVPVGWDEWLRAREAIQ